MAAACGPAFSLRSLEGLSQEKQVLKAMSPGFPEPLLTREFFQGSKLTTARREVLPGSRTTRGASPTLPTQAKNIFKGHLSPT